MKVKLSVNAEDKRTVIELLENLITSINEDELTSSGSVTYDDLEGNETAYSWEIKE